jgi:hypothetical protein
MRTFLSNNAFTSLVLFHFFLVFKIEREENHTPFIYPHVYRSSKTLTRSWQHITFSAVVTPYVAVSDVIVFFAVATSSVAARYDYQCQFAYTDEHGDYLFFWHTPE